MVVPAAMLVKLAPESVILDPLVAAVVASLIRKTLEPGNVINGFPVAFVAVRLAA